MVKIILEYERKATVVASPIKNETTQAAISSNDKTVIFSKVVPPQEPLKSNSTKSSDSPNTVSVGVDSLKTELGSVNELPIPKVKKA